MPSSFQILAAQVLESLILPWKRITKRRAPKQLFHDTA